jgi:hypothetical protein
VHGSCVVTKTISLEIDAYASYEKRPEITREILSAMRLVQSQ